MPRSASIRGQGGRPPRDPPDPTQRAAGGIGGKPSRGGCGLLSKGAPGRRGTDAKPPTPLGFSSRHHPARAGLEREGDAPPPRRAGRRRSRGPEQGHLRRWERRRPSKDIAFNRRPWEEGKIVRVGEGGGADRSRNPYAAGNAFYATPSPFSTGLRLHRRPNVSTTAATLSLSFLL
jgi:hypothetical protein